MADTVEKMGAFTESFNPQQSDVAAVVSHPVKDISSEIRKIRERKAAPKLMKLFGSTDTDKDVTRRLIETAEGLAYLHSHNPLVIHGDMKGANILILDEGSAVLADLGLSRISHEATTSVLRGAGSLRWMAPELVISGVIQSGPLRTMKSDVYGFGHVLLEVLTNQKPFANIREDSHVLVELIKGRRPQRPTGGVAAVWLECMIPQAGSSFTPNQKKT
ncbi:kinase-like domain-containing protein [Hysterangium stoloniferum]|nr:kinase-like domain-containing protein [Hysterangium stoloniferum]